MGKEESVDMKRVVRALVILSIVFAMFTGMLRVLENFGTFALVAVGIQV